jgi:hypothetical protein
MTTFCIFFTPTPRYSFVNFSYRKHKDLKYALYSVLQAFFGCIHSFIHSFIPQSDLRQNQSLFQSEFSSECDLVLSLSICNIFSFHLGHPVATSSSSRHFYPSSCLSFNNAFQKAVPTWDVTNPVSLPSLYCMQDIPVLLDSVILPHFSHDRSNWSPFFSSTTFQNIPGISDLLSEVFTFQRRTTPCSKYSTLLDFSFY